ncbi:MULTISPECIES: hypothetical protein [Enterobacter]|uniref:hypothetical protein n=1 Tax=Enterobacter TaxID=547 RepID=UPI0007A0AF4A|nr:MULTISPECIES: hypothetical protein [Enterobacter]KYQ78328.1 hypothetical protein AX755_09650 [Enterobacter sp. SENG-6]PPV39605.1 hypothetical protein C4L14_00640 [Enterobacter sp. RC4]WKE06042.1 hypothetical protein QOM25_11745 [Enterobacter asburiae]WKE08117.1 hypothetical protein QOM24_18885 [Enterobacter asburiae]
MQPKTQESKDIQTVNRVVMTLRPYLCFEQDITVFVKERTAKQIEEIQDPGLKCSALSVFYFTLGDIERGKSHAEETLKYLPTDTVAWRHYTLGLFWRCGAVEALNVAKRGFDATNSPILASDAYYYSSSVADFSYFLEMREFLLRTEMYEKFREQDQEPDMLRSLEYANIARRYNKEDVIKNISALMYEKLDLVQKLDSAVRLLDVTEDGEEPELIFEMYVNKADAETCAAMNVELISARVRSGLTDWSVGGVYVAHNKEDMLQCQ